MEKEKPGLSRDALKYIAMFTMLLNHIANILMTEATVLRESFLNIGYFTAVTMCYFLVEGYQYTRSKYNYGKRLLIWAFISQIPFSWAFGGEGLFLRLNMLFTLFFCFLILRLQESCCSQFWKIVGTIGLILLTTFSDWQILAPLYTLLFSWAKEEKKKIAVAYCLAMGLFAGFVAVPLGDLASIPFLFGKISGIFLSGICILFFYTGKRAKKFQNVSKWFFYLFYPLHLLILSWIRVWK